MSHPRLTASALARVSACPASAVLPRGDDAGSDDARRGTALHAMVEALATGGSRDAAIAAVPAAWRHTAEGIDLTAALDGRSVYQAEAAYALDVATGHVRCLGRIADRAYPEGAGLVCGTLDLALVRVDGLAWTELAIVDVKTGRGEVPHAAVNPQLRYLALVASQHLRHAGTVAGEIWRVTDVGDVLVESRAEYDALNLAAFELDLRDLARSVAACAAQYAETGAAEVRPGEHCRYCPARRACPAFAAEASALERTEPKWADRFRAMDRAERYVRLVRMEAIVEAIRAIVREDLERAGPIALPGGRTVALAEQSHREITDPDAAHAAVAALLGAEAANDVVPRQLVATVGSIRKRLAARERDREARKSLEADVFGAIEAAGGLGRRVVQKITEGGE